MGLIGAGRNTRDRHIPGFLNVEGVELAAVANRSRESGQRVADSFNIPTVYDNWRDLLDDPSIDAICIGTWPYMHRNLTLAALEKGKHVLTEARMAANAQEAREMLEASRNHPELIAQIVPGPSTFKVDNLIQQKVAEGYLGDLLAVEAQVVSPAFVDAGAPLHWRHNRTFSGYNILNMGIYYECLMRWTGPAVRVMAMTRVNVPGRLDEDGSMHAVTIPDHVDVLMEFANGGQGHMRVSAVTGLARGTEVWLHGSQGTLRVAPNLDVYGGQRGDSQLEPIDNPPEIQYSWRVEEEFISAIRGDEPVTRTPFDVGLHYMEFTEAVTRSAQTGQAISLPL
ncbi:Trans-1,2-dihydrobenzene-1,2-diol dehydrogenase [Geodia barretti]|uniref:Trans-1,2-dihydrobenzene-1,2-diol dehydrogenase n=1 Tax=Geodia barretti TaxID=519541 RepID=A0AA35WTR2_GEOBA|nr:Trans-1,2-dihydrobenzene-1,2-diol dehydrogenase [Geodia barretti]